MKKLTVLILLCLFMLLFGACQDESVSLSNTALTDSSPLISIVYPASLFNGKTSEEACSEALSVPDKVTDAVVSEDGILTLYMTEEQRQIWLVQSIDWMEREQEQWKEAGYRIDIDNEYTEVIFYADKKMERTELINTLAVVTTNMYINQIFSMVPEDEASVHIQIIDQKNGNVLADFTQPGGTFDIQPEDWS